MAVVIGDFAAHCHNVLEGHGLAEEVPLRVIATKRAQNLVLTFRFHAFRGQVHAQCAYDTNHALNDGDLFALVIEVGDKAAIDLDFVERELAQIAERRVAASEIIQGN